MVIAIGDAASWGSRIDPESGLIWLWSFPSWIWDRVSVSQRQRLLSHNRAKSLCSRPNFLLSHYVSVRENIISLLKKSTENEENHSIKQYSQSPENAMLTFPGENSLCTLHWVSCTLPSLEANKKPRTYKTHTHCDNATVKHSHKIFGNALNPR